MNWIKNKWQEYYYVSPFLFFFFYAFIISMMTGITGGDDHVYKNILVDKSVIEFSKDFYAKWGGRVPNHLAVNLFLSLPIYIWRVLNSVVYTLLPIYIYRVVNIFSNKVNNKERNFYIILCTCTLFLFMPISVTNSAIGWITGSFNYNLPVTMLCIAVFPFLLRVMGKEYAKWEFTLAWFAIIWSCYVEQTAAVFVCGSFLCILFCFLNKQIDKKLLVLAIWGIGNSIVQYVAPGNGVRYTTEMLNRFQTFDMLNIWDKVILGTVHFIKNVYEKNNFYYIIILCLLGALVYKKNAFYKIYYVGVWILSWGVLKACMYILTDEVVWEITNLAQLASIGVVILWMLIMAWTLYVLDEKKSRGLFLSITFLASLASGIIMGFSPAIYASGGRVFCLSYVLLIIVITGLLDSVLCNVKE